MRDNGGLEWVALQVMQASATYTPDPGRPAFPHAGRYCSGSTTEVVFEWLFSPRRRRLWWSRELILAGTGRTQKSVDWALLFLRQIKAIETSSDPRSARYHRYKAAPGVKPASLRRSR